MGCRKKKMTDASRSREKKERRKMFYGENEELEGVTT